MRISDWSSDGALPILVFDVLRDGSKIGEHRVLFEREDGTLKVSVETDMSVTFAFLTVFSYEHRRIERWRDGELESLAGRSEERRVGKERVSTCRTRWSTIH